MLPLSAAPNFTPKQGQYLAFIYAYTRVLGRLPAEADLQRHFGVIPPSVHQMVLTLERAGLIERRVERQWRYVRMRSDALEPVESWLSRQRRYWTAALDRLETTAALQTPKRRKS